MLPSIVMFIFSIVLCIVHRSIELCRYYNLMKMGNKSYAASKDGRNEEGPEIYSSNKRN